MAIILVADDHPLNRHFLATLLSYYGHRVNEAADGVEALESARLNRPDLIIADVAMPRLDGFALVQSLRLEPELAGIPVIFYTASYREAESRVIAQAAGVENLISKPADPEVILETVDRVLGRASEVSTEKESLAQARKYVEWLQLSSIRMSALIELGLELFAERDPNRVMRTASRAVRTIFGADYSVIALTGETAKENVWIDGPIDRTQLKELVAGVTPFVSPSLRNVAGGSDPLVQAAAGAMPGVGAILLLPMSRGRDVYGWIALGKSAVSPFSTDDERLGVAAAAQVRAIHENLMLYRAQRQHSAVLSHEREHIEEELRTSRQSLAAVFEASPVAIMALDEKRLVRAWNHAAERIFGWSADEVIGKFNPIIPPQLEADYQTMVRQCLSGATLTDLERSCVRKDGTRLDVSIAMAPLHDIDGVVWGYVSIVSDITDRKRAEAELRSSGERLRALSARILSILEDERTRISRELHDDLGQLLTAIKIDISRVLLDLTNAVTPPQKLRDGIVPLIDSTLKTVGRIVSELRPSRIGEVGLVAAIDRKLADFQDRTEIECELSFRPDTLAVPEIVGTAVFRILEEALTNVARHSGATRLEVRVRQPRPSELLLEIRDNGRGIREAEANSENAYGLIGMRERAYILGGSVTITGIEGKGTIVTARIPIENPNGGNPK
jgi:PAS domain S-box-containing protein